MELVDQFTDIFSSTHRMTHLDHHENKTPPGMVVRQRPYCVEEVG